MLPRQAMRKMIARIIDPSRSLMRSRKGTRNEGTVCAICTLRLAKYPSRASFAELGDPPTEDQFFSSNGVKIRYIAVGKGEPVILVHGFSGNLNMWRPMIADLANDHEVIAFDCRGQHIMGYSMGGFIVVKMLVEHPDRFLTAVIGGSKGLKAEDLKEQASLTKYLQSGMSFSEAVIAAAPPDAPALSAEQREALKRDDPNHDPKALAAQRLGNKELIVNYESLKTNKVPTLVIYGGNDHPERFADLKQALANAEYKVIPGDGHAGAVQSPEFVQDIHAFLKEHQQPLAN